jgi:translation initiation factor IF-2
LTAVAEVRDLKAERQGIRMEGAVIESRVEKGRGCVLSDSAVTCSYSRCRNVATVLVLRGTLAVTDSLVAGTSRCRVRQLVSSAGADLKVANPGQPVEVMGWKDLPAAGDDVIQSHTDDESRRAVEARLRRLEQASLVTDVEAINAKRVAEAAEAAREAAAAALLEKKAGKGKGPAIAPKVEVPEGQAELLLIIKADVSGSQEAVVESLDGIGNQDAVAKVIHSGVGDVSESDVARARAVGGSSLSLRVGRVDSLPATIIGFNVKCPKSLQSQAAAANCPVLIEPIIYRLIEKVTESVENMLKPIVESRIVGEASILKVFHITVHGRVTRPVAGCRIGNGSIGRNAKVRVMRGKQQVYQGRSSGRRPSSS